MVASFVIVPLLCAQRKMCSQSIREHACTEVIKSFLLLTTVGLHNELAYLKTCLSVRSQINSLLYLINLIPLISKFLFPQVLGLYLSLIHI